jgi:methionyl-tRNA formyltransferase
MRVVFMGTPTFAVPALLALVEAGHEVVAVYTQPPRPGGRRGKELTPTPVHKAAEALGIEVRHPASLKEVEEHAAFAALGADIAVVAAYGLILPQAVLDAPSRGCLNIHASLLPEWRGAAPIQRAILDKAAWTGVSIMQMEAGLDTGPVRATARIEIDRMTAGVLTTELAMLGANLIVKVLAELDSYPAVPQSERGVTYARKIDKAETRIDFTSHAADIVYQVQAFAPTPGAWFEWNGERIRVFDAVAAAPADLPKSAKPGTVFHVESKYHTKQGIRKGTLLAIACKSEYLLPIQVQRAGRAEMSNAELLRGFPIPVGTILA